MRVLDNRGGARKGAGRKKGITFKEPTVVMRVPKSLVPKVKQLIAKHRKYNQLKQGIYEKDKQ